MDLYTEEDVAMRRSAARQAIQEGIGKAQDVTIGQLQIYNELCKQSYGVLRPVLYFGMVFMSSVHHKLIEPACPDGCAKTTKRALGYAFCPHCGSKL